MSKPHLMRARRVFAIEVAALRAVAEQLDENFEQAVDWIVQTVSQKGKVVVVGVGKSGLIGRKIAATMTSTGTTSVVLDSVDAMHGDLGLVNDGDIILALSYSGESEEIVNLLPALKRFSVRVIGMTGSPRSALARFSDVVLRCRVPKEACPFNLAPTASTTAMLALGDALAMSVLEARGFREQDFARHHPSGAIGRALLFKVKDVMRSGQRNPVAPQTMTVREALLEMTKAKSGSVSVVDGQGRLAGVFTDGDLRRRMAEDSDILSRSLREVMTRKPICIKEESLAAEALRIFNTHNIDDLVVINARRQPVGLLDSQDLPKLKLM